MGATRWQTIRKVVLPNSISGILTGVILEVSRAIGETAPIMFTGRFSCRSASIRAPRPVRMALSITCSPHDPSTGVSASRTHRLVA
jgi:ABC-type phosphate transport system permease subunit